MISQNIRDGFIEKFAGGDSASSSTPNTQPKIKTTAASIFLSSDCNENQKNTTHDVRGAVQKIIWTPAKARLSHYSGADKPSIEVKTNKGGKQLEVHT